MSTFVRMYVCTCVRAHLRMCSCLRMCACGCARVPACAGKCVNAWYARFYHYFITNEAFTKQFIIGNNIQLCKHS